MARQQFELERAKDIAAEIAIEVENGRRELELHRCPRRLRVEERRRDPATGDEEVAHEPLDSVASSNCPPPDLRCSNIPAADRRHVDDPCREPAGAVSTPAVPRPACTDDGPRSDLRRPRRCAPFG